LRRSLETGELQSFSCLPSYCLDGRYCSSGNDSVVTTTTNEDGTETEVIACCGAFRPPPSANPLCGSCSSDYVDWKGTCVYCTEANVGIIFLLLLAATAFVIYFYRSAQANSAKGRILILFIQVRL
jgi:hypothetical protein